MQYKVSGVWAGLAMSLRSVSVGRGFKRERKVFGHTRTTAPGGHSEKHKHDSYHKQRYTEHAPLHKQHIVPSDGSDRIWHKLKPRTEQTFKRQSEDVEGRKQECREQPIDLEDYYSVIRAPWSRTDKDRRRFPASHTSICHFTMQTIRTHTLRFTLRGKNREGEAG